MSTKNSAEQVLPLTGALKNSDGFDKTMNATPKLKAKNKNPEFATKRATSENPSR